MIQKKSYVYVLANITNRVLYIGVTGDLIKRVWEHKQKLVKGFTEKYNVNKLIYYEIFDDINEAIKREKQLKGGSREKKLKLIESINPGFEDLYERII
ncbi:MAG: GIY-YIG nuclease family protein [Candidatus Levybacteria bacterium]|nr:GIY-YIG nuclease family protein [Candidatus Levybacteria bacterium]